MPVLTDVVEHAARCFARHAGVAGEAVLAAVSGGVDSTVLALVLARLARQGRLPGRLVLAHVDHGQHARSAHATCTVERLARSLGAGFCSRRLAGLGPGADEASMRNERYRALAALAAAHGAGLVATAHHADDDLETVLFRALRGTRARGLVGIPECRPLDGRCHVLRPFLGVRRATLEHLARAHDLPVHEDPTNRDPRHTRNRLRHDVLPALHARAGRDRVEAALRAVAASARTVTDLLAARGRILLAERGHALGHDHALDLQGLTRADLPFLREALRQLDERLRPLGAPSPPAVLDRVVAELVDAPCGQRVHGLGRHALLFERTREGLLVTDPDRHGAAPAGEVEIPLGVAVPFGATGYVLRATPHLQPRAPGPRALPAPGRDAPHGAPSYACARALLDARALGDRVRVRRRRSGDRIHPATAPTPVSLRRFLQAHHLPRVLRDRIPLILDASGNIAWAPGTPPARTAAPRHDLAPCIEVAVDLVPTQP